MFERSVIVVASFALLTACGGGGGPMPGPGAQATQTPTAARSSGDMLAVVSNRGWNYQGTVDGQPLTLTLYSDPVSSGSIDLVLFGIEGATANALAGQKLASAAFTNNASGYDVVNATLYNDNGSVYGMGAAPANTLLVSSALVLGAVSTPYAGVTETVSTVGAVPGESACPVPTATGSTVTYVYAGQSYAISYVPGCGVTAFNGNGTALALTSIGSYPSEGTQAVGRSATLLDTLVTIGRLALGRDRSARMPDVFDTERYGRFTADLTGETAGANGHAFAPDPALSLATGGDGAVAFIEKRLAGPSGATLDRATYDRYACAFGVDASGGGILEHAHDIGREWVSHAAHACDRARTYVALHDLALEAIARLTR